MTYELFLREMYRENCKERESFGEKIYKFEDYIHANEYFLLDKYREVCDNQS